jgi:hypothetical protein
MTPASHIHTAKVLIREAKIRRRAGQVELAKTLARWALNQRRRAHATTYRDLFGVVKSGGSYV